MVGQRSAYEQRVVAVIHSLTYIIDTRAHPTGFHPEYQIDVLQDYLPFLHQLQRLSLFSMHLPPEISQEVARFSAFQQTLTQLSLDRCIVTISAFITAINYFPSLNRLDLSRPFEEDGNPAPPPPLSRSLIGQLRISELSGSGLDFFGRLSELGLVFEEVVFNDRPVVPPRTVEHVINTVGVSLKRLRLAQPFQYRAYITLQAQPTVRLTKSKVTLLQTTGGDTRLRYSLVAESSGNWRFL